MTERPKKAPLGLNRRAVVEGARRAVQGDADNAAFDHLVEEIRRKLVEPPDDSFAGGVQAHQRWRDTLCPNGEHHGLGPYIPPKPSTHRFDEPGELAEFQPHHLALFGLLTKPVAEALGRFALRLTRREAALGWIMEWWKWILGFGGAGWAYAVWGHERLPQVKAALTWVLGHLP